MIDFNIDAVIELLEQANNYGLKISYDENEISVKVPKGEKIDPLLLEQLRTKKEMLVEYFTKYKSESIDDNFKTLQKIDRSGYNNKFPLSFAQERLWFIHQLQGSTAYHMPWVFRLRGIVDRAALQFSFITFIRRHEILRTVIINEEGIGYQQVQDGSNWHLNFFTEKEIFETGETTEKFIENQAQLPFDLAKDEMIRVAVIKITETEHLLAIVLHHIAFDGWSLSVLVDELKELYNSSVQNRKALLAPTNFQYIDYSLWLRQYLGHDLLKTKLDYWKAKLEGVSPIALPANYSRPLQQSMRGCEVSHTIPVQLKEQLTHLANANGCTLFMTLLAAFKVLLFRYSEQNDICVGSPVAGRQHHELEKQIGYFVNTLALRSHVEGTDSFTDFLQQVKKTTLGAYSHQDTPFEKIVEELGQQRDISRSPLFQVMFVLQNNPSASNVAFEGLQLELLDRSTETAKFDLTLIVSISEQGLHLRLSYCIDLFAEPFVEKMLRHYENLLVSVCNDSLRAINRLDIMSQEEIDDIQLQLTGDEQPDFREVSVIDLFNQQVRLHPDSKAVIYCDTFITYRELNEKAEKIACSLLQKGDAIGTMIPICINRSLEMLIGILGILKAGLAFVPIDTDFPDSRISGMIHDLGAPIILTDGAEKPILEALFKEDVIEVVNIEYELNNIDTTVSAMDQVIFKPDALAYVIYTSGSTGIPKGVMIENKQLISYLYSVYNEFELAECKTYGTIASFSADAGITTIFAALCFGGSLNVLSKEYLADLPALASYLKANSIDFYKVTPALLEFFLEYQFAAELLPRKKMGIGGESFTWELVKKAQSLLPEGFELYNHYGPTETTVGVISYLFSDTDIERTNLVPLGKPLAGVRLFILDRYLNPVPSGVTGELYIAGDFLARGYLNNPQFTNDKFIFFKQNGTIIRLYKTGDRVKLNNNLIEFLGRSDDQVKLRGYRIELGEIESALQSMDGIKQGTVALRKDNRGANVLIGYIIPDGELDTGSLMERLRKKLPEYMVPGLWIKMDSFKLTVNGKLDRNALPGIESVNLTRKQQVKPSGEYEISLVKIWEELLDIKPIGVNDNFFALGGHSLLVTRVVAAVRKDLNRELRIKDIFLYPDIASLAAYIEGNGESKSLPSIVQQVRPSHIPLSFAQERLWFIDKLQGGTGYLMPWQIRIKGDLDIVAIEQAFKEIITRHEVLRTVIKEHNGTGYQSVLSPGKWKLNYIGMVDGLNISAFLQQELSTPFDLSADWMLKAHMIKVAQREHILMILIHHIACDGWSVPVLITELKKLYISFCNRQPSPLPELSLQYADYALWQHKYINGDVLKKQLGYWKKQLAGMVPLILPADFTRTAEISTRGQSMSYLLDKTLCEELRSFSKNQGATLYMTLLSAFKVLLYKYTALSDICVGISLANRTQKDIEQLIGFFVNAIAIRSIVDGEQTFLSLLHHVKATLLDAYDNQDIPFEKVVEAAAVKRDMSASPLFPVMFVLQNTPENGDEAELQGLEFLEEPASHNSSKFEITFSLRESKRGINIHVEYCTDLFERATIERMIGHYETILQAIVPLQHIKIGLLPMLKTTEQLQLLKEFTHTAVTYPVDKTVIDLFEKQALAAPGNIAVIFEGQQFTYEALQAKSERLADLLRQKGVKAEVMVPVCLSRTPEMIVAILGILKAGGAFVPIDPDFPAARIQYILDDTAAPIIISDATCKGYVQLKGAEVLDITGDWQKINDKAYVREYNKIDSRQLAYVIYTSGSTGRPKGVLIEHQSILNYLLNCKKRYINEETLAGSYAHLSYTFDAALTAIFLPLICGKPVVIMPEATNADEIFNNDDFKAKAGFDFLKLTPSHLSLLDMATSAEDLKRLKMLIVGGEALHASHFKFLANHGVNTTIINEYGPTEATVGCCIYSIESTAIGNMGAIPIGKPLDNVTMYVLDQYNNPVPLGVTGEICIGGVQVARGYLNLPDLTKVKFIPDPFSGIGKLYKTGDTGRWLSDGNMEYTGRLDDQVKLRGHRIEPGEVENAINLLEQVSSSTVIMVKDPHHTDKLTAYYTAQKEIFKLAERSLYQSRIDKWKEIYETTYAGDKDMDALAEENEDFNITGWNDSFTGGMIEEAQMREWQSDIVNFILADRVTHVLEIGVGMGLIYFQLADKVKHYTGIDLSASAISHLQHIVGKNPEKYCNTYFRACPANEFVIENGPYADTVIINSVSQYFPGEEYLTTLIGKSLTHLNGTGRIIIGDVRDHRLTRLFKCRLVAQQINEPVSIDEFDWMVSQEVIKEEELCFSPGYFYNLKKQFPEITHVDIQLKKGQYSNEMTLYRYNVVLFAGIQKQVVIPVWKSWTDAVTEINEDTLLQQNVPVVGIKDIPNSRLWREKIFDECILNRSVATTREISEKISKVVPDENELLKLMTMAEANGYHCRLLIHQNKLMCNLVLEKDPSSSFIKPLYEALETPQDGLVSAPLFNEIAALWQVEIKQKLLQQLPDYMIPSSFILIDHFPLTSHKKIDKTFLGKLKSGKIFSNTKNIPAVTATEKKVLSLWQELFGTDAIGVTDNFFELGGHSIMMVQLLFHLSEESISLKDLFLYQNVRQQAAYIDKKISQTISPLKNRIILNNHLLLLKQGNAERPLFIVPGSTGVTDSYDELAGYINFDCQILGIQMKGSLPGEKPLENLSELAAQHITWMREVQPAGPYRIIGHSFGGYVTYEMARQLEAEGDTVELLSIIDVDAVSTKIIPETEEDKIDLIMFIAGGVFEKYNLVKKPYPGWVYDIREQLSGLQTVEKIKIKLLSCLLDKFIERKNEMEFLLQLLDLHITNALMDRQIVPAKLKSHLFLVRGKDEDWSGLNDELGWDVRFNSVTVFSVPGTHASMMEQSSDVMGNYFSEKLLFIQGGIIV